MNRSSKFSASEEIEQKVKKSTGFELPETRNRSSGKNSVHTSIYNQTPSSNNSLVKAGRSLVQEGDLYDGSQKMERKKEKQKILDKLEELERIQKFNE